MAPKGLAAGGSTVGGRCSKKYRNITVNNTVVLSAHQILFTSQLSMYNIQ